MEKKNRPPAGQLAWIAGGGVLLAIGGLVSWNVGPHSANALPRPAAAATTKAKSDSAPASWSRESSKALPLADLPVRVEVEGGAIEISVVRKSEWDQALAEIAAVEEPERSEQIRKLAAGVAEGDLADAIAFFRESLPAEIGPEVAAELLRRFAARNPQSAAAVAEKFPAGAERDREMKDVATVWANLDSAQAANWVRQWPAGEARQSGLVAVGYETARTSPVEAMNLAVDLPADAERDGLVHHAMAQWTAADLAAALEWARGIPPSDLHNQVLGRVAVEWADRNPQAAAALAVKEIPAGRVQEDAVVGIVQRWVQTDPEAAAAWVRSFPKGPLQETALANLAAGR